MNFFPFYLLAASFLSLWIRRDPKIWGGLALLSLGIGLSVGNLSWLGLIFLLSLSLLWIAYEQNRSLALFFALICFSALFKLRLLPGFYPLAITPKFALGIEGAFTGLFPLALLVPLASTTQDWKAVFKGFLFGCTGIAFLALVAAIAGVAHWQPKFPSFPITRFASNLILTCVPEEGFFRGFIQRTLCNYFQQVKRGNLLALLLTSLLFTAVHVYWSPNLGVLAFVFLASLLYGSVYLMSGKIESAILTHFLLNFVHMVFFSYHAE